MISAILLAAGEAKRMGKPKQLMPLGGKSILEHSLDNLLGSKVNEVIVVVGCEAEAVAKKVAARMVRIAVNPAYKQGMSTSLVKGLELVSDGATAVMIALADQPFISSQVINQLIDEFETHKKGIAVPVYKGRRGHPIIFAIKYRGELLELSGDAGGKEILERHPDDVLEVDTGSEDIHRDIDDMKSYEREKNIIKQAKITKRQDTITKQKTIINNQATNTKKFQRKMPKTNSINFEELNGKKLALISWGKNDANVFSGFAKWANGHLYLELDTKGKLKSFQLRDDLLAQIKPVPEEIREIVLEADFYADMSAVPSPDEIKASENKKTKWPKKKGTGRGNME